MSNLLRKAKLAVKFRRAGEGHSLNESSTPSTSNQSQAPQKPRKALSSDAEKAGQAALERLDRLQEKQQSRPPKSATATWKTQNNEPCSSSETAQNIAKLKQEVKTEMEREKASNKPQQTTSTEKKVIRQEAATELAVSGVYLKCPFCSNSCLRREVRTHMEECLTKSLVNDPTLTPANMVKSLNKDQAKIQCCVDILVRYLDNILQNSEDEKYRRIKQGNKVFQEKVRPIKGAVEFLLSCGFVEKSFPDIPDAFCFVLEELNADVLEKLLVMKEVLIAAEPCKPTLDRSLKVLQPSPNSETLQLPDDFFHLSSDEVKRMQIERSDEIERNTQLRTRTMREKEDKNPARIYRFTLLRVRFPDGIILQGTFHAREKASALMSFVREQLQSDWLPFVLAEPGGGQLTQEESSFAELGLVPAAILNFAWDATIMADIAATGTTSTDSNVYLKKEILNNLEHTGKS